MSEIDKLPKGWVEATVGDLAGYVNGFVFKPAHWQPSGTPIIRIQNLTNTNKPFNYTNIEVPEVYEINSGDLLVSWSATLDAFIWRGKKAWLNQHIFKVVPEPKLFNAGLLFYWMKVAIEEMVNTEHLHGSTMKHINRGPFLAHATKIPPINEQIRIYEKLEELFSELDVGVKELSGAQIKLTQYRQLLLKCAVEGSLTQQWREARSCSIKKTGEQLLVLALKERRERWEQQKLEEFKTKNKKPSKDWQGKYPEPVTPDTTDLPKLPEGWVWASVDQCTTQPKDITDGPFGSNLKTVHYTESGPRVIRLQNIGDGLFLNDKAHISEDHFQNLQKHAVETDDVLIAMMGESLPRSCIVPNGVAPAIVKADCARVRVNTDLLIPELLSHFLNSSLIKNRTKSAVKGIGRPRINLGYIRSIVIPIPSKAEQKILVEEIINQFDAIDRQLATTRIALKQSKAQRKNILKSAFSGLLVPQDSNDEPALELLNKIKNEREALAKIAKLRTPRQSKIKDNVMNTLLDVLTAEDEWIDAQEAFKKCGIVDGTSTDRIEEIYTELRQLEKTGHIEIERNGSYDQLKLIKLDAKED